MALTKKRLTHLIGSIEAIHAVVCDKKKEMDRAGDVIVALKIEGRWYEVIRLTEACNYFAGGSPRAGLASALARKNGKKNPPHAGDNWDPYK